MNFYKYCNCDRCSRERNKSRTFERFVLFVLSFWALIALVCYLNSAHAQEPPLPKGPYYLIKYRLDVRTGEQDNAPAIEAGPFDSVDECRAQQVGKPAEHPVDGWVYVHECSVSHIDKEA